MARKAFREDFISEYTVKRAAFATKAQGSYRIVDSKEGGFFVHVGQDTKSYRLQIDVPHPDPEKTRQRQTRGFSLGKWPTTSADEARQKAKDIIARRDRGEPLDGPTDAITLLEGWESYKALMNKKERSERTIEDYTDKVERCLHRLHYKPLRDITRQDAINLHTEISTKAAPRKDDSTSRKKPKPAPYLANGCMRVAHAIYNHVAKDLEKPLPPLNPFRARNLHNKEKRRVSDLNEAALPAWFESLKTISSPILREWHWLSLLTGLRRRTVEPIRLDEIHKTHINVPKPKGGEARAFKVPITKAIGRSLDRARRAREWAVPSDDPNPFLFPSPRSKTGHIVEPRFPGAETTPHDLRGSFILFATGAGVMKTHRQVLANHRVAKDVHEEYMSVPAMFDQLRDAQEKVSEYILAHVGRGAERTLEQLLRRDLTPKTEDQQERERAMLRAGQARRRAEKARAEAAQAA